MTKRCPDVTVTEFRPRDRFGLCLDPHSYLYEELVPVAAVSLPSARTSRGRRFFPIISSALGEFAASRTHSDQLLELTDGTPCFRATRARMYGGVVLGLQCDEPGHCLSILGNFTVGAQRYSARNQIWGPIVPSFPYSRLAVVAEVSGPSPHEPEPQQDPREQGLELVEILARELHERL
jgi:hypothetical protein